MIMQVGVSVLVGLWKAGKAPTDVAAFVSTIFFFQAKDGIRDLTVTGVQTCALPISDLQRVSLVRRPAAGAGAALADPARRGGGGARDEGGLSLRAVTGGDPRRPAAPPRAEIGRASCRERV